MNATDAYRQSRDQLPHLRGRGRVRDRTNLRGDVSCLGRDDAGRNTEAMSGGYYHTGDVTSRDAEGYRQ